MLDRWDQWKIPIIIVVFALSMVFSTNYLNDSSEEHVVNDTKTGSTVQGQCYICHQDGKVGNKSILDNVGDIENDKRTIYGSQRGSQRDSDITSFNAHTPRLIQPINLSNTSMDDKQLVNLIVESDKIITKDILDARDAANKSNYKNFEISGVNLKLDSHRYMNMTRSLNISYSLKNLSDEYVQMLEDFYNVGKYIESGARDPFSKDIDKSIDYLREGTKHMNNIRNVLKISGVYSSMSQTKTDITGNYRK